MNHRSTTLATVLAMLGVGSARADCVDDLAGLSGSADGGMSKDGSLAPLQTDRERGPSAPTTDGGRASGVSGSVDRSGGIAKDGTSAPLLENEVDASDASVATSQAEVEAQQGCGDRADAI